MLAGAAEDGWGIPCGARPGLDGVIGEGFVTVLAGVVEAAAGHLDGDDVERGVVVETAGLRVELEAVDFWRVMGHLFMIAEVGAAARCASVHECAGWRQPARYTDKKLFVRVGSQAWRIR